jgi:hypothetical protein
MKWEVHNGKIEIITFVVKFRSNNSRIGDFADRIYPIELEIKDTKDTYKSASNLDLHLEIDSEGWLRMKPYDKRDGNHKLWNIISSERYVPHIQVLLECCYI